MHPRLPFLSFLVVAGFLFLPDGKTGDSTDPADVSRFRKRDVADFRALDRNGDGTVGFDEWRGLLRGRPLRIRERFAELDRNRNGRLSLGEFARKLEERPKPDRRPSAPFRPWPVPDFSRYVGLALDEARLLAESEERRHRLVSLDGVSFPVTRDYRPDRVNFTVIAGVVTEARGY